MSGEGLYRGNRYAELIRSTRDAGVELFNFALYPEGEEMVRYNREHPDACVTRFTSDPAWGSGSSQEILGDFASKIHPDDLPEVAAYIQTHLEAAAHGVSDVAKFSSSRFRVSEPDGSFTWHEIRSRLYRHEGDLVIVEGLFTEVTGLMTLLYSDPLTGLPNRLAAERFVTARLGGDGYQSVVAIDLDLDGFRNFNFYTGHEQGDLLIREAARLLREALDERHLLARVGPDEFIVLLLLDQEQTRAGGVGAWAETEAHRLKNLLHDRLSTPERSGMRFTASCGIAIAERGGWEGLLEQANTALGQAKAAGPGNLFLYTAALREQLESRLRLVRELERAIEGNELRLVYQPQVDNAGRWIGAEVLVRWPRADGSFVSPGVFVPLAEESGLIHDLGFWVLKETCEQLGRWHREGLKPPPLAINLSSIQLETPPHRQRNLFESLEALWSEHQLAANDLYFELTETALLQDWELAASRFKLLASAGVKLAIDDFGTGYSSLKLLQMLPVRMIKLDMSFIRKLPESESDYRLVRGSIQIAKQLEMTTLAEGVETEAQWLCLRALGCDFYQGYFFSRPLTPERFGEELLRNTADQAVGGVIDTEESSSAQNAR